MKKLLPTFIFFLLTSTLLFSQRMRKTNKFAFSASANIGQVIPNFTTDHTRWKAGYHLSGGFTLGTEVRLHEHWSAGMGLGLTFFYLDNRGPSENYVLDFFSPHLMGGLSYLWRDAHGRESFFRLNGGLQIGYDRAFVETFDGYEVQISSDDPLYFFARPEVGFRKTTEWKTKTSRYRMSYEVGSYVRHYFNGLGKVVFVEDRFSSPAEPRGFTLGIFFRILMPYGNESTKVLAPENFYPPVIYNPRY